MTRWMAVLIGFAGLTTLLVSKQKTDQKLIGVLPGGARLTAFTSSSGMGIAITGSGSASAEQGKPVQLEFYEGDTSRKGNLRTLRP